MRPARSGETELPATSPERQVVGLDSSNEGSRMRSSNIVGTPCTIVTRSRRINASAPAASNRSCSTSVAPAVIVTATTCIPKIVNTGTAPSTRSSPVVPPAIGPTHENQRAQLRQVREDLVVQLDEI